MPDTAKTPDTMEQAPFPPLTWEEDHWVGTAALPSWAGFRLPEGNWNAVDAAKESDGTVRLEVHTPAGEKHAPKPEQGAAYQHWLDNEEGIRNGILQAIFKGYPEQQQAYGFDAQGDDEADERMPNIAKPDELKMLIGLSKVHLLSEEKDKTAYLGFEFGCTWDDGHGLGVMTHNGKVIGMGDAEASDTLWVAQEGAVDSE